MLNCLIKLDIVSDDADASTRDKKLGIKNDTFESYFPSKHSLIKHLKLLCQYSQTPEYVQVFFLNYKK